jgi:hypothetical protein
MKFVEIDGCPVPTGAAPVVREIKQRTGMRLTSCYRGSDPAAATILRRFGKSTQAWLYRAYWVLRLPGYNPANQPGFSTHECFNDGVAFSWAPRGHAIPGWAVGQDWPNGARAAQAAREGGYVATLTYPNSLGERQHINCRKKPKIKTFRTLKLGSRGRAVQKLQVRLRTLGYLPASFKTGKTLGGPTVTGLKNFQHDHHLKADGVYGIHTHRQLLASVAWHKKHDK